ncbi:MAG: phenylalanine--tRNA ligase subunit beta [Candidatus Levybacteria bacterium]|nr:phenylalanine--tRNA ligase subunit beta [Candidatus Levybacteria bacterium]
MNIKILDSWLREYLKTKATAAQIAEKLSLTSVSVEKIEKFGKGDFVYDIEVTTNRPDLMSVVGLARETAVILEQSDIKAQFLPPKLIKESEKPKETLEIEVKNDSNLVNRACAVIMKVDVNESPSYIKEKLEASGIRSLNNLIDVTNYIMREVGHPAHVFDYDRLTTKKLIIRESKKGEKIVTLDGKPHILHGGDIVADNGRGEIIDLLGVMGTANSVVTPKTKRILFFIDNNDPHRVRKTSMSLAIRSEAAVLNEKSVDPNFAMDALIRGIELFKEIANGRLLSEIIDIYDNKPKNKRILISKEKIDDVIGVEIPLKTSLEILTNLGFKVTTSENEISINVPSWRLNDIEIQEDIVEEIARVYGYYKLPSLLPPLKGAENYHISKDLFYWEKRIKNAMKYWGFTEVYTYSMVSEDLLEGPTSQALEISNPLNVDLVYMRKTLIPSLLKVLRNNENIEDIKIFELANVYNPKNNDLPAETLNLCGVLKKQRITIYEIKGLVEQILTDFGIKDFEFKKGESGGLSFSLYLKNEHLGEIEVLDENIADFEINFDILIKHASLKKAYQPIPKFPPVIEDLRFIINPGVSYSQIVSLIKKQDSLVTEVNLLDVYEDKKTFRIKYQDPQKTLTNEEVSKIREKIISSLEKNLKAKIA